MTRPAFLTAKRPCNHADAIPATDGCEYGDRTVLCIRLLLDDVYELFRDAAGPWRLSYDGTNGSSIAPDTQNRHSGAARASKDLCADFMCRLWQITTRSCWFDGARTDGRRADLAIPLSSAVGRKWQYRWLHRHQTMRQEIAQVALRVLYPRPPHHQWSAKQLPIEDLVVGGQDTHPHDGRAGIRWISQSTVRCRRC